MEGSQEPLTTPQCSCFHSRNESGCEFCVGAGFEPVHCTLDEVGSLPDNISPSSMEPSASPCHCSCFHLSHHVLEREGWWEAALEGTPIAGGGIAHLAEEVPLLHPRRLVISCDLWGSWARNPLSWGFWWPLQRGCRDLWGQVSDVTSVLDRLPSLLHPALRAPRQWHPAPLHWGRRGHPQVQQAL